MMRIRTLLASLLMSCALTVYAQNSSQTVTIDANAQAHPFPHFWEQMFGSGRAVLSLRDSYRRDLNEVNQITGFQYVRFHGILNDDVGIYGEDKHGNPVYNFSYVDQIYDGLLAARREAVCRDSASCRTSWLAITDSAFVLVQAERLAAEGLRDVG